MKRSAWLCLLLALGVATCTDDGDGEKGDDGSGDGSDGDSGGGSDGDSAGGSDGDSGGGSDGDSGGDSGGDSDGGTDSEGDPGTGSDMGGSTSVIFLHHSTGSNIWGGGVSGWIDTYNTDNGTSYDVTERAYPEGDYPWANYPYDYWYLWVDNAGPDPVQGQDTLEILTEQYDVVAFKHCYPVSGVVADAGNPDISSETKSIENYTLQYEALKTKLLSFPDNRFIVWTGAALVEGSTNEDDATRARQFFNWVKETWDEPGDNIYVWDFWQLETEGGLYLLDEHAASPTDSHPNADFSAAVAPLFGNRIVDVIEGRGDTGSLSGE